MSDSIKVAIKVRPLIKREKDENLPIQWTTQGNAIVAVDSELKKRGDGGFQFDHIFDMNSTNNDVFCSIVSPIVDAAVNGFNGTVVAYGQTSSGKTYTMMGIEEEVGVIQLAVQRIFDTIANNPTRQFLLRVSYLEIYNEKINDLLNKESDLKIHEDINGQIFVKCKEEVTNSPEGILSVMSKGNKNKRIGETNMNDRSSRSHTIFRIVIESREADAGSNSAIKVAQLNLVDLAGSERARHTGATGERFKEGRLINLSLSTLALVIKQLSESQDSQKFINFRDSKLTRLLQTSLGGNAMTVMICAVTPAALDETQCTLSFASRAKSVQNKPQLNEVMSDGVLLKRYAKQIDKLKTEIERVKQQNWCVEVQEMESKIQEKDRINEELEERIRLLQTRIIAGDNRNNVQELFKVKAKRRQTWCGTGAKRKSMFHVAGNLSPIKENSPLHNSNETVNLVDMDTSLTRIAYTDFELELMRNEDHEEENSDDDSFEIYRKKKQFEKNNLDDTTAHKSSYCGYDNLTVSSANSTSIHTTYGKSPGTPKEALREKMRRMKIEYSELQEFTTLEKQLYFEDHHSELQEKLTKLDRLEKQLENLSSEKDAYENIASDLRKQWNMAEQRRASAEEKLNAQTAELQKIPQLEKKLAYLSEQEIKAQRIPELEEKITTLTAEKDGYEYVATDLRKKLKEAEQQNLLLEDKIASQSAEEEPLIRFSIGNESAQQTLASAKDEVSDLRNKLTEAELCNDTLRDQLKEQQSTREQNLQDLKKRLNSLASEKSELENVVGKLQGTLNDMRMESDSIKCEQFAKEEKLQDQERRIQQLVSEKHELESIVGELQEKLVEAEITTTSMKGEINEHQRCAQQFSQLEKQIQDVITDKMEHERTNEELRNKTREVELANCCLTTQLNEQQLKICVLEKQIEDAATEREELDGAVAELKERLRETELMNSSLLDKVNERETNMSKMDDSREISSTETLMFESSKFERTGCESQEELKEEEPYDSLAEEGTNATTSVSADSIEEREEAESCNSSAKSVGNMPESTMHESQVESAEAEQHRSSAGEDEERLHPRRIEELEAQVARLTSEKDEPELTGSPSRKETAVDNDEVAHLRSRLNDLQNTLLDIQSENARLKEHAYDVYNGGSPKIDLSSTRMSLDDDSAKLSADLVTKTQELDEIKHDVQSLKEDIENLQKTILLLTTENTELANKLSAEKACADQAGAHLQKTIDELYARNSRITDEKIELESNIATLNERIEMLRSKIPEVNLNDEQMMFKYEEQINALTARNAELKCKIEENMSELDTLKESKSLLYEHDCMYKDKLTDILRINIELTEESTSLGDRVSSLVEENVDLKKEHDILKNKLELSLKNKEDASGNDTEQLRTENTLLKTDLIELRAKEKTLMEENTKLSTQLMEVIEDQDLDNTQMVGSCDNTLHLSTIFNNTSAANDTMNKSTVNGEDPEVRILKLQEEANQLRLLNRKLSDLKLSPCTQCSHLKELIENRRMLKVEMKSISHRLADLQSKFDRNSAKSDALIMKANSSLVNTSFSESMNVTYFEEQLECISNDIQSLKENDNKLSELYEDKCDEIGDLQVSSVADSAFTDDESSKVKKSPNKITSRLDKIQNVMGILQNELQDLKNNSRSVKMDLDKFTSEKESQLIAINSLKTTNENLLQKLSKKERSLTTALEKANILENEITDVTNRLQELTAKGTEIEKAKLVLEIDIEVLREDQQMKGQTISELRQNLSCLQHKLDLVRKQKEEVDSSSAFVEQEYDRKLKSLMATNKELADSKATVSREFDNYTKESENRMLELTEKVSRCNSENEYLKQELIRLRDIESKLEKMRNEYQSKSQQDKTLTEDNKKLKEMLNATSESIVKEIQSLKPKIGIQEFSGKSIDELFQMFLQTIMTKQKEIATIMQRQFEKEKHRLEDEKQQSVDVEKRITLWAKELESETEKLQGDLSKRESMSDELQKEVTRLQQLLDENKQDKDALKEKISLLETDLSNLQSEFDKHTKHDSANEEAIIVAQRRERQAQEAIKNKEAEFQMKLKSEKDAYNKRVEDLACTVESFKSKNMELTSNIEGLTANENQLRNIVDLKTNELVKCNQIIQKMQSDLEQLTDAYNDSNQELEAKKSRVAEITELLKTKCDELAERKTNLEALMQENKFLKQQVSERKANVEQYKAEIESLKMTNEKAIDSFKDQLNFAELTSAELKKQTVELNNKNVALTEELKNMSSDHETLRSKCVVLEKRMRNSTSKIQAEEQIEELKDLNRSLRNNLDGASNRITELQTAKTDLMKQLVILNSQHESTCNENGELKETLSSYKSKYNDAYSNATSEKYDALLQEKNQVALELEAVKMQLSQRDRDIENYASKVKELTEKNEELDQESEELAETIRQNDADYARMQDQYYMCRNEVSELKDNIEALERKNQSLSQTAQQRTNSAPSDVCSCIILKDKIRELQSDVVRKNGKIATLELQIRSGNFPYQVKCKELQEHLSTYTNKNSELKAEVKRLQLAMLRVSAKECDVCKDRLLNRRNQACQTIANNTVRFCSLSSGIIAEELRIAKLEKEKEFLRNTCRSQRFTMKQLQKQLTEYETLLQSYDPNAIPESSSLLTHH